jgi:ribosomal protein L37AE/L43A
MKIPNISEIVKAWKISFNPTPEQQEIAEIRSKICDSCEFKNFKKLTRTFVCDACGCPIAKKIYSPSGPGACPKNKWDI